MAKNSYSDDVRRIQTTLSGVEDAALLSLSARAIACVEGLLQVSKSVDQTAAYHTVAQKLENLDAALQKLNESTRFLDESQGDIKNDWEVLASMDASKVRGALSTLISCCELLDRSDVTKRLASESQILSKIVADMEKIRKNDRGSCEAFAKLSNEFEQSLRNLDGILGSASRPVTDFEEYSKFSGALEDLIERIERLRESLKFVEDKHARRDWEYFMEIDLNLLKESIKTSYNSSMQLIDAVAQK